MTNGNARFLKARRHAALNVMVYFVCGVLDETKLELRTLSTSNGVRYLQPHRKFPKKTVQNDYQVSQGCGNCLLLVSSTEAQHPLVCPVYLTYEHYCMITKKKHATYPSYKR